MKHIYKLTTLACVSLVLGGCSSFFGKSGYIRDKGGDYINEEMTPALKVPSSLNVVQSTEFMVIPEISNHVKPVEGDVVPRADRRVVRDDGDAYQIISGLDGRHLMAERAPDEVWSQLVHFWEANEISLAEQEPREGVMETDWVQINGTSNPGLMRRMMGRVLDLDNSRDSQEKFLVRVRQGVRAGTSDIQLLHARRATGSDLSTPVDWNSVTDSSDALENGMLNEMLVFLVQNRDDVSVSLLAKDLGVGEQTSIIRDGNGNPVLKIDLGFARSWQGVELALKKTGISVVDKNRSAGLIFINLPAGNLDGDELEKKDSGWFSGLFGSSDEDEAAGMEEYRIRVQSVGSATHVTLEKSLEALATEELSLKFLERLRENLG
ncbi:outer membrane protein assembly factor BamC [Sansalvadorimonas verongulae]|uniref:outer membrane protein assembly factor BamC n=1 Tax=Sansalvadorimonas verongulae TaxID=2172824 RepID=UPI0012BCC1F3|nr:outer membrane protein assembly factor BamC [Sansalvadorimonas verongulae]MTI15164.1 outer membrane protein assembly factor BamC [Sansalvadorimonas verongulae]